MKEIEFLFPIRPMPHQSVRTAKGMFYQPKKVTEFKKKIESILRGKLPNGFEMWDREVPLIMSVRYMFKYRASEPKKNFGRLMPKISKPDVTDNLNKALVDAMAGIVFEQDQQIYGLHAFKYWWERDEIYVKIQAV